jgi:hypothetical protein
MQTQPRTTDSIRSLASLLLVFVIVITLLESGGLVTWANRLDISVWRNIALPSATAVHEGLQPLHVEYLREQALAGLDRLQRDTPVVAATNTDMMQCPPTTADTASPSPPVAVVPPPPLPPIDAASLSRIVLPADTGLPALPPLTADKPRVVALVGDSMMTVGLSATLLRGMARHPNLKAVRVFRSGTGLSRPEIFDWMTQYPTLLGDEQPDVILVAIGANDAQGFVENGKVLAFGSDAWITTYRNRLSEFLRMLTQQGASVVWLSLPPMKQAKYSQHMDTLNRIAYQVVSENPNAHWFNTTPYIGDEQGQFREYAQGQNNRVIRVRADDGAHLSDEGAALLSGPLLAWLDPPPAPASTTTTPAASPSP